LHFYLAVPVFWYLLHFKGGIDIIALMMGISAIDAIERNA